MQDGRLDTLASPRALGRFLLLGLGVWLHAADTLVTATLAPDIVADLDGVAYVNWTISLYEVGAIVAGAATGLGCVRLGNRRVFILGTVVYGERIGYAVGTATVGIAANLSGLADGISAAAAKTAGFWVFAAFIPVLAVGLASAWRFTGRDAFRYGIVSRSFSDIPPPTYEP